MKEEGREEDQPGGGSSAERPVSAMPQRRVLSSVLAPMPLPPVRSHQLFRQTVHEVLYLRGASRVRMEARGGASSDTGCLLPVGNERVRRRNGFALPQADTARKKNARRSTGESMLHSTHREAPLPCHPVQQLHVVSCARSRESERGQASQEERSSDGKQNAAVRRRRSSWVFCFVPSKSLPSTCTAVSRGAATMRCWADCAFGRICASLDGETSEEMRQQGAQSRGHAA